MESDFGVLSKVLSYMRSESKNALSAVLSNEGRVVGRVVDLKDLTDLKGDVNPKP
jgi:hypothetical protein